MNINLKKDWKKLDNAAKIFPALVSQDDSEVFRISCQLYEEVEPDILQRALDSAIEEFPAFTETVKRGMFWYYLEDSGLMPKVHEETEPPLQPLYTKNTNGLLIDISYYKCRINFEVFHAICDGTGAFMFFRTLVATYLCYRYDIPLNRINLGINGTDREKAADSFSQYYEKEKGRGSNPNEFLGNAKKSRIYKFNEQRTPDLRQLVTEGEVSVACIKRAAHYYNTTITVFLTSLLIFAIYDTMDPRDRKKAVSIAVPVNLRNYFASNTARNFFGIIHVVYDFGKHKADFSEIIAYVSEAFKTELTKENLEKKIAGQVKLERNFGIRMIPLWLKDFGMGISEKIAMSRRTICLSNVGKIDMPPELSPYINKFDVFNSSASRQVCMCSFGDRMVITFSGVLSEHDVEQSFFCMLAEYAARFAESAENMPADANGGACIISTNYSAKEFTEK